MTVTYYGSEEITQVFVLGEEVVFQFVAYE